VKVGDLVRWKPHGDIGVFIRLKEGRWKPFCEVYLLQCADFYHINVGELEVIGGKEREAKEDSKEEEESEV
jgi:hypothetical protein